MLRYFIFLANQVGLKGINSVQKWQTLHYVNIEPFFKFPSKSAHNKIS